MSVSVDGYIADRDGAFGWTAPSDELFAFHLGRVREPGAHLCGRRLYETIPIVVGGASCPSMPALPRGSGGIGVPGD